MVLHGMGGVGKTTVALEVAHRCVSRSVTAWWVPGHDPDSMRAGLYAVGFAAGARDADFNHGHPTDVLWQYLNGAGKPWLLVIDNVDDPAALGGADRPLADGTGWLRPPVNPLGAVLLSSRDGRAESWAPWARMYPVQPLSPAAGADVLLDLAAHAGSPREARKLAVSLGGLPLALNLAGRYLATAAIDPFPTTEKPESFAAYRDSLQRNLLEFTMSDDAVDAVDNVRNALAATWEMSLNLLTKQGHDLARPLLRLFSCCAATALPYRALLGTEQLDQSPLFRNPYPQRLSDCLHALSGLGLVTIEMGASSRDTWSDMLTLHPLVRSIVRAELRQSGESAPYLNTLTEILREVTAGLAPDAVDDWPRWAALAPHCFAALELAQITASAATARSAIRTARTAAWYRYMAGLYHQAADDFREILNAAFRFFAETDPEILQLRNELTRCIRETGRSEIAESEFRSILATARTSLGSEHPLTINIHVNLARTIRENGRRAVAETEFRSIVDVARQSLGEDHPDTLSAQINLAVTLRQEGRFDEAEAEYRTALAAWRRKHTEEDLTTLDIRFELAETMRQNGSAQGAAHECREILSICQRVYGSDHPNSLIIRYGLAMALRASGELDAARAELSAVLEHRRSRLGVDHPFSRATEAELASLG